MGSDGFFGTLVDLYTFAEMNSLSFAVYEVEVPEPSTVYPTDIKPDACDFYILHSGSMGSNGHFDLAVRQEVIIKGCYYKNRTFESYVYALRKTCLNNSKIVI